MYIPFCGILYKFGLKERILICAALRPPTSTAVNADVVDETFWQWQAPLVQRAVNQVWTGISLIRLVSLNDLLVIGDVKHVLYWKLL